MSSTEMCPKWKNIFQNSEVEAFLLFSEEFGIALADLKCKILGCKQGISLCLTKLFWFQNLHDQNKD